MWLRTSTKIIESERQPSQFRVGYRLSLTTSHNRGTYFFFFLNIIPWRIFVMVKCTQCERLIFFFIFPLPCFFSFFFVTWNSCILSSGYEVLFNENFFLSYNKYRKIGSGCVHNKQLFKYKIQHLNPDHHGNWLLIY